MFPLLNRQQLELKGPCHKVRKELKEYKSSDILETVLEKQNGTPGQETFYINDLVFFFLPSRKIVSLRHQFLDTGGFLGDWNDHFSKSRLEDVIKERKIVQLFSDWIDTDENPVHATVTVYFSELGIKKLEKFLLKHF